MYLCTEYIFAHLTFSLVVFHNYFTVGFLGLFFFRKAELSFIFVFWNLPIQTWNKNSRNNLQKNVFVMCINTKASYAPPRILYFLGTTRGPRKHTKLTIFIKSQELEYLVELRCWIVLLKFQPVTPCHSPSLPVSLHHHSRSLSLLTLQAWSFQRAQYTHTSKIL